jgi:membrane protease YdiL (CAAX protease family)
VGLVAGVIYNWWMVRTRSLGDLILAHGITNACLSAYVVFAGHWEYWA